MDWDFIKLEVKDLIAINTLLSFYTSALRYLYLNVLRPYDINTFLSFYLNVFLYQCINVPCNVICLDNDIEKSKVAIEIKGKEALKARLEAKVLEIEKGKLKFKNWQSKGTRDNPPPTIFHTEKVSNKGPQ